MIFGGALMAPTSRAAVPTTVARDPARASSTVTQELFANLCVLCAFAVNLDA
jgi:hypothetical protein